MKKRTYKYWTEYYNKSGKEVKKFMRAQNITQARKIVERLIEEGTLYSIREIPV